MSSSVHAIFRCHHCRHDHCLTSPPLRQYSRYHKPYPLYMPRVTWHGCESVVWPDRYWSLDNLQQLHHICRVKLPVGMGISAVISSAISSTWRSNGGGIIVHGSQSTMLSASSGHSQSCPSLSCVSENYDDWAVLYPKVESVGSGLSSVCNVARG